MAVHIRDCFAWFMETTVNLNKTRLDTLESAYQSIEDYVTPPGGFALGMHAQGSYAQGTIIHPGSTGEFDADALVEMEYDAALLPRDYYERVYDEMKRSGKWGSKVGRRKQHCVRIEYAGDFHLDLVPYIVVNGHPHIVDRRAGGEDENGNKLGELVRSNPLGYVDWVRQMDVLANGHLVPVIRLFKQLRGQQGTYRIPSIILSTLLGSRMETIEARVEPEAFEDLPGSFAFIARLLKTYLDNNAIFMPTISDPSSPGDSFNHRWSEAQYLEFRDCILRKIAQIIDADEEDDHDLAIEKWQKVFGDRFVEPNPEDVIELSNRSASTRAPNEMFPDEEFRISPRPEHLQITTEVKESSSAIPRRFARLNAKLGKNHDLRFFASEPVSVRAPYDVFWKVRNRGDEAHGLRKLRGEIVPPKNLSRPLEHQESTLYVGDHYVEAYVVKDGELVAYGHSDVPIG